MLLPGVPRSSRQATAPILRTRLPSRPLVFMQGEAKTSGRQLTPLGKRLAHILPAMRRE